VARLGVLGWPLAHSRSPAMHEAALRALGLEDWSYQHLPVPPELFAETVRALPDSGFAGVNVTIPHKEAALAAATRAEAAAWAIGAANTLTFEDGEIHALNSDAPGLLAALPESPRGLTALVLGAGGSARAAAWALREAGAEVSVWNRTGARARVLAKELGIAAVEATGEGEAGAAVADGVAKPDLVVNCTAVGLGANDDPFAALPLTADVLARARWVVDLAYGERETRLVAAARSAGTETVDGHEVLVQQGALSFEHWTGRRAPLEIMRAAARSGL
jgi:shikimate dehydrogenase